MRHPHFRRLRTLCRLIWPGLLASLVVACGSGDSGKPAPQTPGSIALRAFASSTELQDFVRAASADNRGPRLPSQGGAEPVFGAPGAPASDTAGAPGAGFSGTTLQEPGVDEPDLVKTDGRFLYIAHGIDVEIVDTQANPGGVKQVAAIPIAGLVTGLFLSDSTLVVFHEANAEQLPPGVTLAVSYVATGVVVIDVADPTRPVIQRQVLFEGAYTAARLLDGRLHVILRSGVADIGVSGGNIGPGSSGDAMPPGAVSSPVAAAADDPVELLPRYFELQSGTLLASGPAVAATSVYHPEQPSYLQLVLIVTFDMADLAKNFSSIAYLGDSQVSYASSSALYLTESRYDVTLPGPLPPPSRDGTIPATPAPASAALRVNESATIIHKFRFQPAGVVLAASGGVPGNLLSQYALGEFEDRLRVASHDWGAGSNVYVLAQQAGELAIIGSLEHIKPGENLTSARFIGARGYLVTFRQIDPFFVVDLADPTAPRIAGELETPGFSTYLQPLDGDHLLAIGTAVTADRGTGAKVSLFDVTNPAQPTLQSEITLPEGSYSEAQSDPKAFTFWPTQGLLSIPSSGGAMVQPVADASNTYSHGIRIFTVDSQSGLSERGYLDMTASGYPSWTRTAFSGDALFGITNSAVYAARTAEPGVATATLALPAHSSDVGETKPPVGIAVPLRVPSP